MSCSLAGVCSCDIIAAAEPQLGVMPLREAFPVGYQYHVSCRVEVDGKIRLPEMAKEVTITGSSAIEYDERILEAKDDSDVRKTLRLYRRLDFERKVGDKRQENSLRPAVQRLVLIRHGQSEVPFSPDGPMLWSEIDLVRTDVFTPALQGLFSKDGVRAGDNWQAATSAVMELTDMEKIERGSLLCKLEQVEALQSRRVARVSFRGSVRGLNEDGPNQQDLDGYCYFDLQGSYMSYLSLRGVSSLLDKEGSPQGRVEGRFVLTRLPRPNLDDLGEQTARRIRTEPDAQNTQLLYDNSDLGIRFIHPRGWRVAGVRGKQIALDEARGSGLLITVEPPSRTPSSQEYLREALDWLNKEKGQLKRMDQPQRIQPSPKEMDRFGIDAIVGGQAVVLDYYIARQSSGGAAVVGRFPTGNDREALRREALQVARSIEIYKAS